METVSQGLGILFPLEYWHLEFVEGLASPCAGVLKEQTRLRETGKEVWFQLSVSIPLGQFEAQSPTRGGKGTHGSVGVREDQVNP